jgi:hypothetical protein
VTYPGFTPVGNATLVVANVLTCNKHSQLVDKPSHALAHSNPALHAQTWLLLSAGSSTCQTPTSFALPYCTPHAGYTDCKANYAGVDCTACGAGSTSPGSTASKSLVCTSSCIMPMVTVTPPAEPLYICSNSPARTLGVTFRVQSDTGDSISVPRTITASDERVCTAQGSITNRESLDLSRRHL